MLILVIQSEIDQKLYCLTKPAHSKVLAPAIRSRDVEAEVGGQRPADAEARGLRSRGLRSRGQRDQVPNPNEEVQDQRGRDLSWRINR